VNLKSEKEFISSDSLKNPTYFCADYLAEVLVKYGSEKQKSLGQRYLELYNEYRKNGINPEDNNYLKSLRLQIKQTFKDYKQRKKQ